MRATPVSTTPTASWLSQSAWEAGRAVRRNRRPPVNRAAPGAGGWTNARILAALILVTLLLAACGAVASDEDDPPPPTATTQPSATSTPATVSTPATAAQTLDADGLPVGVVGPLLLYRTVVEDQPSFGLNSPSPEVVVYDAGADAEVTRIWIGNPARQPQASFLAGAHIVVNFGDTVERFALDGFRDTLFAAPPGTIITGLQADSASGVAVIAVQPRLNGPVTLHWIDVLTAAPLREQAAIDFGGPGVPLPRTSGPPDDELLLRGVTYSEELGGYAALSSSGSVRDLTVSGLVQPSPDGAFLAHGPGRLCGGVGGPSIEVTAVATDTVVARYADPSVALLAWDWSPDSQELAIQVRPLLGGSECPNTLVAPSWLALSVDGTVRAISSDVSLRNEWFGDRAITFRCNTQLDGGWFSRRDGLLRPNTCLPFDVEILVGNRPIAVEGTAAILGFIEVE